MGKKYSPDIRDAILERYRAGEPVTTISSSTGIARSTIYTWINQSIAVSRRTEVSLYDYKLLEKKAARLEQIIEVITKAKCSPGAPLKVKLSALEALHGQYSVHLLCEALDVPRGTFYNHIYRNKRDKTLYKQRREELRIEIKKIYDDSNQIFDAKKICAILKERGHSITKEMVADMLQRVLKLEPSALPKKLDATDALAIAYCHFLQLGLPLRTGKPVKNWAEFARQNASRIHK